MTCHVELLLHTSLSERREVRRCGAVAHRREHLLLLLLLLLRRRWLLHWHCLRWHCLATERRLHLLLHCGRRRLHRWRLHLLLMCWHHLLLWLLLLRWQRWMLRRGCAVHALVCRSIGLWSLLLLRLDGIILLLLLLLLYRTHESGGCSRIHETRTSNELLLLSVCSSYLCRRANRRCHT